MTKKQSFAQRMRTAMDIRNMKQVDLVELTGLTKSAINQYYSGKYEPKQKGVYLIAQALNVSESWLMGYDVPMERLNVKYPDNVYKIERKQYPLLGTIAAGQPIFAAEDFCTYVEADNNLHADFCLKIKGDSMINARICDGDIVFIRKQDVVDDGEIAAVLIGDEATLKRVYRSNGNIILASENPRYKPLIYEGEKLSEVRILGKAVAFQGKIA